MIAYDLGVVCTPGGVSETKSIVARVMKSTGSSYAEVDGARDIMWITSDSGEVSKSLHRTVQESSVSSGTKYKLQALLETNASATYTTAADMCGMVLRREV